VRHATISFPDYTREGAMPLCDYALGTRLDTLLKLVLILTSHDYI
jgi:hypothetical protein